MPELSGETRSAGVIGWPVAHSRSPRLHNAWLARYGINGVYVPLPVAPDDVAVAVRGLAAAGFAGVNVTVPHKEAAFALCDTRDRAAEAAGSVNTLLFKDGLIHGRSTDGWGFLESLRAARIDPAAGPALLLGAGGAAAAIAAALRALGVAITITNRSRARADQLAARIGGRAHDWAAREALLSDHALLVNTTTLGMRGQDPLALDLAAAPAGLAVADIVYVPLETDLVARARARGLRAVGGLGMLLHQARPGFAAWFGIMPTVDTALVELIARDIPPR